jgi:hypothetical protein
MILLPCLGCKSKNTAVRGAKTVVGALVLILACSLTVAPAARGHVLQGLHVLELMANALSAGRSLQVRQLVWLAEGAGEAQAVEYTETLDYLFPGRFRSEARYEDSHRVLVSNHDRTVTVINGTMVSETDNRFEVYKDLLLHQPRNAIARKLVDWGVDIGASSLGLWDEDVVYVIGAHYPDESVSQVWVDKERFLPVRWIIHPPYSPRAGHSQVLEFAYRQWRQHGETWYPMLIDTYLDGRMIRQGRVTQVDVNTVGPEIFDIDRLIAISERTESSPDDRKLEELQPTVDDFKEKLQP